MPHIFHSFVNGKTERYIIAALQVKPLLLEYVVYRTIKIPPLVAHPQHTARRKFRYIFIIGLGRKLMVNNTLMVFLI